MKNYFIFFDKIYNIAEKNGLLVRAIGGFAIVKKYAKYLIRKGIIRSIKDIDFLIFEEHINDFVKILSDLKFEPDQEFNFLYGSKRRIYKSGNLVLDIFINSIDMNCNLTIPKERLRKYEEIIPSTEMLLEKLQIKDLTKNKYTDMICIFNNELINSSDSDISLPIMINYLNDNWPFYHISEHNLGQAMKIVKTSN
ncbi:MAG: hypothetical protein A2V66_13915, partial [Ignavibacteria bacterium RBG_13_36_8]